MSGQSRLAALESAPATSGNLLTQFSVEQLEQHLAQRRLGSESAQLESVSVESSSASVVSADSKVSDVVGPTPNLDIAVEGVLVSSLIDSGSQLTHSLVRATFFDTG